MVIIPEVQKMKLFVTKLGLYQRRSNNLSWPLTDFSSCPLNLILLCLLAYVFAEAPLDSCDGVLIAVDQTVVVSSVISVYEIVLNFHSISVQCALDFSSI